MEITKREIIASISIILIMFILGLLISNEITKEVIDNNAEYEKALKINDDKELFKYAIDTESGNAFVYGELIAEDPVNYEEVGGEYLYIKKEREEYTKHERTYKDDEGKEQTEVYYSWDKTGEEEKKSNNIKFLGIKVNINVPFESYISTIEESKKVRYVYSGYPAESKGSIYEYLNKDFSSKTIYFKPGKTAEELYNEMINDYSNIFFWIFWILIIILCVFGFYYLENNWLND